MPAPKPVLKIAYKNTSGEAVPPHAVVQFDSDVEDIDSGISVNIVKPTSDGEHFALDEGKGAASEEEGGNYGQCIKALNGVFWAYYVAEDPPEEAWVTEVGPVDGEWYVDDTGSGFVYAGLHEPDNERILVMQLAGGGAKHAIRVELLDGTRQGKLRTIYDEEGNPVNTFPYLRAQKLKWNAEENGWEGRTFENEIEGSEDYVEIFYDPDARGFVMGRDGRGIIEPDNPVNDLPMLSLGDIAVAHWDNERGEYYLAELPRRIMHGTIIAAPEGEDPPAGHNVYFSASTGGIAVTIQTLQRGSWLYTEGNAGGGDGITQGWAIHNDGDEADDLPNGTKVIIVWDDARPAFRVIASDSSELEVACGLMFVDDPEDPDDGKLKVDNTALAGNGLTVGENCALDVDCEYIAQCLVGGTILVGCGLTYSGPDEDGKMTLGVDNAALAGSGLIAEGECAIAVDTEVDPYGSGGSFLSVTAIDIECSGNGQIFLTYQVTLFSLDVTAAGVVVGVTAGTPTTVVKTAEDCCCTPTPDCAESFCTYESNGTSWDLVASNCYADCECGPAPYEIQSLGATVEVPCVAVNSCEDHGCTYRSNGASWDLVENKCLEGCRCGDPPASVGPDGTLIYVPCEEGIASVCCDLTGVETLTADNNAGATLTLDEVGVPGSPSYIKTGLMDSFVTLTYECVDDVHTLSVVPEPGNPYYGDPPITYVGALISCESPMQVEFSNVDLGGTIRTVTITE